jgi:molybdopterin-guanine dinucleotide biosynthesis protein A
MIGIVLCGGESSRMGSDKGLLKKNDLTWAQHAFSKLSSLQIPVFISVNKKQVDGYLEYFELSQLVIDDESISVGGPLLGLLSAHQLFCNEDLFVLACDMINMNETTIQNMLDCYKKESSEAYVYEIDGRAQPLCSIYTSNGLSKFNSLYSQGQIKKYSMMYALDCIDTKYIPVHESGIDVFNNCNAPEDIVVK